MDTRVLEWEDKCGTSWRLKLVPGHLATTLAIMCFLKEPELGTGPGFKGKADFDMEFAPPECLGPEYGHLGFIKVDCSYRRRGIASYMINLGTDWLASRGKRGMWGSLDAIYDTGINKRFYEYNGFSVILDKPDADRSDGLVFLDFT